MAWFKGTGWGGDAEGWAAPVASGGGGLTVTHIGDFETDSNSGTLSSNTFNIGSATAGRAIVVCVASAGYSGTEPTTAAVGGSTIPVRASYPWGNDYLAMVFAGFAASESGTVTISVSGVGINVPRKMTVYKIEGLSSDTPKSTGGGWGSLSGGLTVPTFAAAAGDVIICAAYGHLANTDFSGSTETPDNIRTAEILGASVYGAAADYVVNATTGAFKLASTNVGGSGTNARLAYISYGA